MTADHGVRPPIADVIASCFSSTSCPTSLGNAVRKFQRIRAAFTLIRLTAARLRPVVVVGPRANVSAAGRSAAGSHALTGTATACRRTLLHLIPSCILDRAGPHVALTRGPRGRLGLRESTTCWWSKCMLRQVRFFSYWNSLRLQRHVNG